MKDLCGTCIAKRVCMFNHQANNNENNGVFFTARRCLYYECDDQGNTINTQNNRINISSFEDVVQNMRIVNEASKKYDSIKSIDIPDGIEKKLDEATPCPICGTPTTTLVKCSECEKYGCYNCMTTTIDNKMICSDCF